MSADCQQLARLMLLYPLAYAVIWSLPTAIRIYQTISGSPAPWQLQTADKACVVVQGLVDAIIYGATESSLSSWRKLFFPRAFPTFPTVNGVAPTVAYGNSCGDGPRKWGFTHTGDKQLLSGPPTRDPTLATTESVNSLEISSTAGTAADSGGQIELETFKGTRPSMSIQKTVEIEVMSSTDWVRQHDPQRPPKLYFPGDRQTVSHD
jgi:G protein-coupled glucose receptor regulating Gpa2 C-term